MENKPLVSVIMSAYNAEKYISQTIKSVLNQTFIDFEFLIFNDGSKDKTEEIIGSYGDHRIKSVNQSNIGLTKTLNKALALSQGEYIARMDADDICEPARLQKQVDFLKNHPEIGICGTWVKMIDADGTFIKNYDLPTENKDIRKMLLLHNPLIHPSVMFRRKIYSDIGGYDESFRFAQDYEYWTRILAKYQAANLPEYLLNYRVFDQNITKSNNLTVRLLGIKIRLLALWRVGLHL